MSARPSRSWSPTTAIVAEDAAALVEVDYEALPAVADCRKAAAPDAPAVRRELNSNIVATYKVDYGDAEAAFGRAAHVFHEELWQHRGGAHPIEGRGLVAEFRADRRQHDGLGIDPEGARPVPDR